MSSARKSESPAVSPARRRPGPKPGAASGSEAQTYALLLEVERYESLAEEMDDLGVTSLADIRAKVLALHQRLDALD